MMMKSPWPPRPKRNAPAGLRGFILVMLWGVWALSIDREAAEAQKIYLIGSLTTSEQFVPSLDGFKSRMAELGYKEGLNVRYSFYNSKGDQQLLKTQTEKLVQEKPDLIVTTSTTATLVVAKATERLGIPVLFLSAGNPSLLVKSFKSSGTNLAGISSGSLELVGKRFELLRELSPKIKRIAMPIDPKSLLYQSNMAEAEQSATKMGMTLKEIPVESAEELLKASGSIDRREVDAIFMPPDSLISEGVDSLVRQANKERLPMVGSVLGLVKRGCLSSYAADYLALGKQGAALGDKILKGVKPADLPIEMPSKFYLALNLKTAKTIDLKIPKELLLRADQVFE
jgi:putative ABC transport system substrate-binding protein